jgi:hypothetical protein
MRSEEEIRAQLERIERANKKHCRANAIEDAASLTPLMFTLEWVLGKEINWRLIGAITKDDR